MTFWIKEISWKKVFLTSFLYTIVAFIIHQVEAFLTLGYYMNPNYYGLWSKLMMPKAGPPPAEFMIASLVLTFITGISLALVYYYLRDHLPGKKLKRITYFTDLMIGTYFIFFTMPTYLMFNVPFGLLISWLISSFIILLSESFFLVKLIN